MLVALSFRKGPGSWLLLQSDLLIVSAATSPGPSSRKLLLATKWGFSQAQIWSCLPPSPQKLPWASGSQIRILILNLGSQTSSQSVSSHLAAWASCLVLSLRSQLPLILMHQWIPLTVQWLLEVNAFSSICQGSMLFPVVRVQAAEGQTTAPCLSPSVWGSRMERQFAFFPPNPYAHLCIKTCEFDSLLTAKASQQSHPGRNWLVFLL